MRALVFFVLMAMAAAAAQATPQTAQPTANTAAVDVSLGNTLSQLENVMQQANMSLGKMRIDKWKTDGDTKKQAQGSAELIQRNLTATLPEMIGQIRMAPQDSAITFKLYRQLSAVSDEFSKLAEAAGAFGPKDQYQQLADQASGLDTARRALADRMQALTSAKEAEIQQLRKQVRAAQAAPQVAAPPKKIVVDDTNPQPKTKKKKAKPATPPPS